MRNLFFVVLIGLSGFIGLQSNAKASFEDGKAAAARVCMSLSFSNDQERCMKIVRNAEYFTADAVQYCAAKSFSNKIVDCINGIADQYYDVGAINVCRTYSSFESNQDNCMRAIAGKNYERYELDYCRSLNFDSKILQCMKDSGKTWNPGPPNQCNKDYVRRRLRQAISDIDLGNSHRARLLLQQLYSELEY